MLRILLFGGLHVLHDGRPVRVAVLPKTPPLFAYLLLHRTRPVQRDALAFTLWPDIPETDARSNLRRHLHDLRGALPPPQDGAPWLLSDAATVQWNPDADYWLDVAEFERLSAMPGRLSDASALYVGDLLEDIYDDCLFFDRERLRNQYFANLQRLIACYRSCGDVPAAIAVAQLACGRDPLREDIARELIALRHQSGDRAGALQEYRRLATTLKEELGVAPMPETVALYDQVLKAGLPAAAPSTASSEAPSLSRPSHNLPAQLTSFIGREQELLALRRLISPDADQARMAARLVTLTGPGGTGKTRLAIEFTERLLRDRPSLFSDGVTFVRLSDIGDPALVPQVLAQALGVQEAVGGHLVADLKNFLRAKRTLLILDNFERVIEAAAFLTELLAAAHDVSVLVTSRVVLRAYGEREQPVPPLPLPDPDRPHALDELAQCPAVALFVERALAVNPSFVLTPDNAAAVAEICRRLDGLPLAIELAAGRTHLLPPAALLERLQSSLAVLTGRLRNVPPRQQAMRNTIDWSYGLLDESLRKLFTRLAVFHGSFSLASARAIIEDDLDVEAGAAALVDQSMLRPVFEFEADAAPRFRLLRLLREYALEKLAAGGEIPSLRRRHANHYLALAESAASAQAERSASASGAATDAAWLRTFETEYDNLRGALNWAMESQESELSLRLASALAVYWVVSGRLREGCEALARALALPPADDPRYRAEALYHAGQLACQQEAASS